MGSDPVVVLPPTFDDNTDFLQIQEELTRQVANSIQELLGASGVGVVIEARHLCMMMRGVEKQNSEMTTSCMLGEFRSNGQTRSEFLSLITG